MRIALNSPVSIPESIGSIKATVSMNGETGWNAKLRPLAGVTSREDLKAGLSAFFE